MQVLVTETQYYISVGGRHFAAFRHRLPFSRVTCLQVVGDVTDVQVEQLDVMEYPDKMASNGAMTNNDDSNDDDSNFVRTIPCMSASEDNNTSNGNYLVSLLDIYVTNNIQNSILRFLKK